MENSTARLLPERDYAALKAATRDLVEAAGGGKRVAGKTRTSEVRISDAASIKVMDRFAAIDVIADLEADTETPIVTRCLADLAGFNLVAREIARDPDMLGHLARIARETGEVIAGLSASLADGHHSDQEKAALRKEIREAIEHLQALDAALSPGGPR